MLWAYLLAVIGCAAIALLSVPTDRYTAISFAVGGVLAWVFAVANAVIAVFNAARADAEAQALANMGLAKPVQPLHETQFSYDDTPTHKLYVSLPIPPAKIKTLAQAYTQAYQQKYEIPFSEPEWVDRRGIFSAREFRLLQAEALKRGWIVAKNADPRQGYKLTTAGRHILARIADGTIRPEVARLPH